MASPERPDIGFIPTPADAIAAALELACPSPQDIIYDLGCGDGRLLLQAVQAYGCGGVGIDVDGRQLDTARHQARLQGVDHRLEFRQGNLYTADFTEATIVFLYLLPHLNLRLRPRLWQQLRPGARVISHQFDMGDWPPQQVLKLSPSEEDSTLYLWTIAAPGAPES